ncbi:cellulose binding domain-containing protein [Marinobacter lacisalsi]|uniref:Cellulose binding domain-containing protein n=1 Tax=Marinobacter lacisalsi TaxID=475979 RepID=A0ABV8QFF7_9GAMM
MKTKSRLALLLCGTALSGTAAAESLCDVEYRIQHSWQTGAVHRVQMTYNGPEVSGWELSWTFPGQDTIDSIFNVTHTQEGQDVTVENLLWNARLREGREIKFGFNVRNPSGEIPEQFYLNGEPCGEQTDSPEEPEDPDEPDTPDENPDDNPGDDSGNDSGDGDTPDDGQGNDGDEEPGDGNGDSGDDPQTPDTPSAWSLDADDSYLGFVTTKNTHKVESHRFATLSGAVTGDGVATLDIDLNTVETGIDIRNQRLKEMLFNTGQTPTATVAIELGENLSQVQGLDAGDVMTLEVPAQVQISGETREINSQLRVQHLGEQRFLVSSAQPLIITADQFGLEGGVEALREVAGLNSISIAVPVDFALFFEADGPTAP